MKDGTAKSSHPAAATYYKAAIPLLALLWGFNWPAVRIALIEINPWAFRAAAMGLGAVILAGVAVARGNSLAVKRAALAPACRRGRSDDCRVQHSPDVCAIVRPDLARRHRDVHDADLDCRVRAISFPNRWITDVASDWHWVSQDSIALGWPLVRAGRGHRRTVSFAWRQVSAGHSERSSVNVFRSMRRR